MNMCKYIYLACFVAYNVSNASIKKPENANENN